MYIRTTLLMSFQSLGPGCTVLCGELQPGHGNDECPSSNIRCPRVGHRITWTLDISCWILDSLFQYCKASLLSRSRLPHSVGAVNNRRGS